MRGIILIFLLFIFSISCSKKNKIDNDIPKDIPAWLQTTIKEIKKGDFKGSYQIAEYKIDGMIFYSIAAPYTSCILCELYDIKGIRANISFDEQTSVEKLRTIWSVIRR